MPHMMMHGIVHPAVPSITEAVNKLIELFGLTIQHLPQAIMKLASLFGLGVPA